MIENDEKDIYDVTWLAMQVYGIIIIGWVLSIAIILILCGDNVSKLTLIAFNNQTLPVVMATHVVLIATAFPGMCLIAIVGNLKPIINDVKEFINLVKIYYTENVVKNKENIH